MSKIKCPECKNNTLVLENKDGVNIDKCSNCEGVFLDFKEIIDLIKNNLSVEEKEYSNIEKGDFSKDHSHEEYTCPKCNIPMEEREYLYGCGIHIDWCNSCRGMYLNKGEISEIKKYFFSQKNSKESKKNEALAKGLLADIEIEQKKKLKDLEADTFLKKIAKYL